MIQLQFISPLRYSHAEANRRIPAKNKDKEAGYEIKRTNDVVDD